MSFKTQSALMTSRRFLPLFITQFLGAFNDNFFKSAMLMLITYRLADESGMDPRVLVNMAGGVFILPFFLFSATAGQLADKYERSSLTRLTKLAEIAAMAGAAAGFLLGSVPLLMLILFLMGAQSTFFGPLKFSMLPQHLEEHELVAGNGLIQMGTFLAILTGTIFGGLSVAGDGGAVTSGVLAVLIAAAGWLASLFVPRTTPVDPSLRIEPNFIAETLRIMRGIAAGRDILRAVTGISIFWFVGVTFLSQFPTYSKIVLGADETVATSFLAVFSVGIGLGSMACDLLIKRRGAAEDGSVSDAELWALVPPSALLMSAAGVLLWFVSSSVPVSEHADYYIGLAEFLSSPRSWVIMLCFTAISFLGGIYIVPLYAVLQRAESDVSTASVIAGLNITTSLFMVFSALGSSALIMAGVSIPQIFLALSLLTAVSAVLIKISVRRGEADCR